MLTISADDEIAVRLTDAIRSGDLEGLKHLLDGTPGLAEARIVDGKGVERTLLHVVADWPGHFPNGAATVRLLVAAGADVDGAVGHSPNGLAETPLHWAASSDDVAVLDALLDSGADIEAPGAIFTGGAPMSDAVVFAQWRAAGRLLERGAGTTIWQAAALGQLDEVRRHAEGDPRPTADDISNALWHGCRGGQLQVARYLVEQGADISRVGHERKAPLDVARESGASDLVEWLEDRGARSVRTSP